MEQPEPDSAMAMNAAPASERRASRFQPFDKGAPDSTSAMLQSLGLRAGERRFPRSGTKRLISALAARAPDFRPNEDGCCGVLRREYRQSAAAGGPRPHPSAAGNAAAPTGTCAPPTRARI